jgi:CheY-like chemotaxis protein
MKILVVDDEQLVRECLVGLLRFDAHEVQAAAGGEAALALLARQSFDLILMDYAMPDMKGDELALAIRALQPDQPNIMLTGNAPPFRELEDVDFIISKPIMLDDLRHAIAILVETRCIAS